MSILLITAAFFAVFPMPVSRNLAAVLSVAGMAVFLIACGNIAYTAHRLNLQYDPTADRQPGIFWTALL